MNISVEEAKMIKAAFAAWEAESRSDEPHWTFTAEYQEFRARLKEFINKQNNG